MRSVWSVIFGPAWGLFPPVAIGWVIAVASGHLEPVLAVVTGLVCFGAWLVLGLRTWVAVEPSVLRWRNGLGQHSAHVAEISRFRIETFRAVRFPFDACIVELRSGERHWLVGTLSLTRRGADRWASRFESTLDLAETG